MYDFILGMWKMNRVDEAFVNYQYEKGRITLEQKETILATERDTI